MQEREYEHLLEVRNLHVHYITDEEDVRAVNGISFYLDEGDTLGLVGETGAGKTTTAKAIMQLIASPPGFITEGEILFRGRDLVSMPESEKRRLRGSGVSMIFQDPMTALNPTMTIGKQLMEAVRRDRRVSAKEARAAAIEMLEVVGVRADRFNDYPHQFSGGMKQRVVITMALLCRPDILIADEPTTALDVTIQAQVLEIFSRLREQFKMAMIMITHDLGIVAETCERVAVVYAGEIVESGTVREVFKNPRHPYTKGLFDSIPRLDTASARLTPIPGLTPNMAHPPSGCPFHPRCGRCRDICTRTAPEMDGGSHGCKCFFPLDGKEGD